MKNNRINGFVTLLAVAIIVIVALLAAAFMHANVSNVTGSGNLQATNKALTLANSGLEDAAVRLRANTLTNRPTCAGLNITHTIGNDTYQVTSVGNGPNLANSTLGSAMTAASTSVTVANSSVFQPQGRIIVDRELIEYKNNNTSTNTLSMLTRGLNFSLIASHANGNIVTQYQCLINAIGTSPATNPSAQNQLNMAVQLEEVWAMGDNGTYLRWNRDTENQWVYTAPSTGSANINSASATGYMNTGWALAGCYTGGYTVSDQESWGTGNCGGGFGIYRYTPSLGSFCQLTTSSGCGGVSISTLSSNKNYYAVQVIDYSGNGLGNFGFIGGGDSSSGNILKYNGTQWTDSVIVSAGVAQINGISIIRNGGSSPKEAWAAATTSGGAGTGKILKWTTAISWTTAVNADKPMNAISMIDTTGNGVAHYGWAVGDNGHAYVYNGSVWTNSNIPTSGNNLYGVVVLSAKNAWAVGDNGARYHWDGSSWTLNNTGYATSQTLRAVDAIAPPASSPTAGWSIIGQ